MGLREDHESTVARLRGRHAEVNSQARDCGTESGCGLKGVAVVVLVVIIFIVIAAALS